MSSPIRSNSTILNLSASVDATGTFYVFKEGLADATCVGPAPVPCASDAEVFTLSLSNGSTSFVADVDPSATAIWGASPVAPDPATVLLAGIGIAAVSISRRRGRVRPDKSLASAESSVRHSSVNRANRRYQRDAVRYCDRVFTQLNTGDGTQITKG